MFGVTKIIYITKEKIIALEVVDVAKKRIGKSFDYGWGLDTLDLVLTEIIKVFRTKKFRILVSDNLNYVTRLTVPADVPRNNIRAYILERLQEKIPDTIEEGEWDYKELGKGAQKDVIAFALVKDFAKALTRAVTKLGLDIEAIEPEAISKTRDVNAYIGIVKKEDISGRDEDVLNLSTKSSEGLGPTSGGSGFGGLLKKFIKILIILGLIGLILGGAFLTYSRRSEIVSFLSSRLGRSASEQVATSTPEATSTPSGEPGVEAGFDLAGVRVQIQNGSGLTGEAGVVSETLGFEGFSNISTGTADNFNYQNTEVRLKEGTSDEIYSAVERALNSDYTVVRSGDLVPGDSEFDVIIIVGVRKSQ